MAHSLWSTSSNKSLSSGDERYEGPKVRSGDRRRFVGCLAVIAIVGVASWQLSIWGRMRRDTVVYSSHSDSLVARRQRRLLEGLHHVVMRPHEQRQFVADNCPEALNRYDEFYDDSQSQHLAIELWKYCALSSGLSKTAAYIDLSSPLQMESIVSLLQQSKNLAILSSNYEPNTVHGTLLVLRMMEQSTIATPMLHILLQTPAKKLLQKPFLLPKLLYALLAQNTQTKVLKPGKHKKNWLLLDQHCHMTAHHDAHAADDTHWFDSDSVRSKHACPLLGDFCCAVRDVTKRQQVMMNQHPIHPIPLLSESGQKARLLPLNASEGWNQNDDLPYITTLKIEYEAPNRLQHKVRSMSLERFDDLLRNSCLPSEACNACLVEFDGCSECTEDCGCYCKTLCKDITVPPDVTLRLVAQPPAFGRDPNRMIPRIIHQTWHERIKVDDYPDTSRLMQSLRKSGWEYRYYTDDDVVDFLQTHFPPEILEAYKILRPPQMKSHLFRYCVVFIFGGLYADIDVLLESRLDTSIGPDIGFIAPLDEPSETDSCLSKAFFAAAPGHPFLARAIETLVNQVRNRFSLVDMDNSFCPKPDLFSIRSEKTSFLTGSCLLGTSVNSVLGRPRIYPFEAGEVEHQHSKLPGRTIILQHDRHDMGTKRYTNIDRNLIMAAAEVEVSEEGEERLRLLNHTVDAGSRFDLSELYSDSSRATENIRIRVDFKR